MKDTTIEITFTKEDIKALEYKTGKIKDKQDLYDAVFEAITTFLELQRNDNGKENNYKLSEISRK